jgi:hypothetical protein
LSSAARFLPGPIASLFLLAACAVAGACAGTGDPIIGGGGGETGTPDSGMTVMVDPPCNDLANTAAPIHISCGTCTNCPESGSPAVTDGTYGMTTLVLYTSDCERLTTASFAGTMQVRGSVIDLVIQQPGSAIGDTVTSRFRYQYTLSGSNMSVLWTCGGTQENPTTQGVNYFSDGKALRFSIMPGTRGDTVFKRL